MTRAAENHADDTATLKAVIASQRSEIEHLKLVVAKLQRLQFGRRAERLDVSIDQLNLLADAPSSAGTAPVLPSLEAPRPERRKPVRKPLPVHLPRETLVHTGTDSCCPDCGGRLRQIGEDVAEMLEYVPARFKVIRHVRPKLACGRCDTIVQAAAPQRPIARGMAGPGLLAHVLVAKYCDHLPLYRQSAIYAREDVDLPRSTLAGWVGESAALLQPLVEAIRRHVLAGATLHADDTPVPVLSPGKGRTKTARLWAYVRDDRPAASLDPPAVWFAYSENRKGCHPQAHLAPFKGVLQADAYAGFDALFEGGTIVEAACWAHVRRKFYDIHRASASPLAAEALTRIQALYAIEAQVRGKPPTHRAGAAAPAGGRPAPGGHA